jgi:hypothetical protein
MSRILVMTEGIQPLFYGGAGIKNMQLVARVTRTEGTVSSA